MAHDDGVDLKAKVGRTLRARRWIGVGLIGVLSVAGPANLARAITIGAWEMNEPTGGSQMFNDVLFGQHSLPFIGATTDGSKYTFPGWAANVDATGRLTGVLANSSIGEIRVPDAAGWLSPGAGSFGIKLSLRPALVNGGLPLPGTGSLAAPSYNILQRGRATDAGGFYKLELVGIGTKIGKVHCGMKAPGYSSLDVYSAPILDGKPHTIECTLDRLARVLRITTDGFVSGTKSFKTYGVILPRDAYGTYLTVGKKPGSIDPGDAFAGEIDYVTISR